MLGRLLDSDWRQPPRFVRRNNRYATSWSARSPEAFKRTVRTLASDQSRRDRSLRIDGICNGSQRHGFLSPAIHRYERA